MSRTLLLTPGPSNTSGAVRAALGRGDECPREEDFAASVRRVRSLLLDVLVAGAPPGAADGWAAVPLAGSGTAAVEAALTSLVPADGRVLVAENGAYGERAATILGRRRVPHEVLSTPWDRPLEPAAVADALAGGFTHLYLVHHETTSGVLNPLAAVARAGRAAGATVMVDAMSSFGAVHLADALASLDVVVSSANKCVQGVPGVSFVLARRGLLDVAADPPPPSLYLDVGRAAEHLDRTGHFLFTPPVQVVWALEAALEELADETVAGRRARYDACYRTLRETTDELGLRPVVDPAHHSRLLTAFAEPDGAWFDFRALHDGLREDGVTIYPGKIPGLPSFRLATMGHMTADDVAWGMASLRRRVGRMRGAGG